MKRTYLLGVVAAYVIAACSSSKDSVLNSGTGGNGHGGAAGTGSSGNGGTASGGTGVAGQGGAAVLCDGGAVIICTDGTKTCSLTACPPTGGTGGGAGTTGTAGRGGSGGSGGSSGSSGGGSGGAAGAGGTGGRGAGVICAYPESTRCPAGLCGNGVRDMCTVGLPADCTNTTFTEWCDGADLGTATCASRGLGSGTVRCKSDCGFDTSGCSGAQGGSGGSGGTTGTGGSGGTTGSGGTGGRACETAQCLRPYVCKRSCGGPVESNNCCACEPPLFDDFNGQVCGDGGTSSVTYVGCRFIGGINRVVVAKRDTARNLCFNLALIESNMSPPPGLTLPVPYIVQSATVGAAAACPTMAALPTPASQVAGSVSLVLNGGDAWGAADVDLTMTFGTNDAGAPPSETLSAHGVSLLTPCQ